MEYNPALGAGLVQQFYDNRDRVNYYEKSPAIVKKPYKVHYGQDAVDKVAEREGQLTPPMEAVIREEGFVDGVYEDTKGIKTSGVGQTGKYMDMSFRESFLDHEKLVKEIIPNFMIFNDDTQAQLLSLGYRGDTKSKKGKPLKWVKLFNDGEYKKAATELLDHKEYKGLVKRFKEEGVDSGIIHRLEAAATQIASLQADPPEEEVAEEEVAEKEVAEETFSNAFRKASKEGAKTFDWNGKSYSTKQA